ncbi:MAG: hypothetical protein DMD39_05030 [Gemmatimonadetes bacterium]|nr:MAG: hypothetical protein DMD39_05030 [Gemmatimonadota bacterium]
MHRYELVSGIIFTIVALAQLTRTLLGWPAQVSSFNVPIWWSGLAFLIAGTMAVWAFRSAARSPTSI